MGELNIQKDDLEEALRRLQAGIDQEGSQIAFAKKHGLSHTIISQVMRRRIDPPPQVLAAIGLERIVSYRDIARTPRRRNIHVVNA